MEHGDPIEASGGFDGLEELGGDFVDFGDKVGIVGEGKRGEEVAEVGGGFKLGCEGGQVRDAEGVGVGDFGLNGEEVAEDGGVGDRFGVFISVLDDRGVEC